MVRNRLNNKCFGLYFTIWNFYNKSCKISYNLCFWTKIKMCNCWKNIIITSSSLILWSWWWWPPRLMHPCLLRDQFTNELQNISWWKIFLFNVRKYFSWRHGRRYWYLWLDPDCDILGHGGGHPPLLSLCLLKSKFSPDIVRVGLALTPL